MQSGFWKADGFLGLGVVVLFGLSTRIIPLVTSCASRAEIRVLDADHAGEAEFI